MPELGINVDHVATLRQARGGKVPDPIKGALICEKAGCDSIVAHLREDRRHINDRDVEALKKRLKTKLNLEMSINKGIVRIAKRILPYQATLVPEKRQELTTEGGLSVYRNKKKVGKVVEELLKKSIKVSLFIDPDKREIKATKEIGAKIIEIHTGLYSEVVKKNRVRKEYEKIKSACEYALELGLIVNAGHGLDYNNVKPIAKIKGMNELNIGHSIISYSVFVGLCEAVKEMKRLIK